MEGSNRGLIYKPHLTPYALAETATHPGQPGWYPGDVNNRRAS